MADQLTNYETQKSSLATDYIQQLQTARRAQEIARQQLEEQNILSQRQLQQGLYKRGLVGSGVQQLGQIQGQLALSKQMNEQAVTQAASEQGLYNAYKQNVQQLEDKRSATVGQIEALAAQTKLTGESLSSYLKAQAQAKGVILSEAEETAMTYNVQEAQKTNTAATATDTDVLYANVIGYKPLNETSILTNPITERERDRLKTYFDKSKYLDLDKDEGKKLAAFMASHTGDQVEVIPADKKWFKGQINDVYEIKVGDEVAEIAGAELAALIMTGKISVSAEDALNLVRKDNGESWLTPGAQWGNKFDGILKQYWQWLSDKNYVVYSQLDLDQTVPAVGSNTSYTMS